MGIEEQGMRCYLRAITIIAVVAISLTCTGCEAVGALAEVMGGAILAPAEVAGGAIFSESFRGGSLRGTIRSSVQSRGLTGLLDTLTRDGSVGAGLLLDNAGRLYSGGRFVGIVERNGTLRAGSVEPALAEFHDGLIFEGGRPVGRISAVVDGLRVPTRTAPHTTAPILRTLERGAIVEIARIQDGWYQIRLDPQHVGWIPEKSAPRNPGLRSFCLRSLSQHSIPQSRAFRGDFVQYPFHIGPRSPSSKVGNGSI